MKVTVEWVALLLHILQVTGSNQSPEMRYPWGFVDEFSPSKQILGYCLHLNKGCYLSYLLQSHSHLSSNDWLLSHLFQFHIHKIIPWLLSLIYAPIQYSLNMPWLLLVTTAPIQHSLNMPWLLSLTYAPIQYSPNMPWLLLVTTAPIQHSITNHTIIQHCTTEIYWWPC
jgi:hypothetical protein